MLGQQDTVSPLKVRRRMRQILPSMDLRKSQKDIYALLETELGKPLCIVGKGVVKEEIEMFLLDRASQPGDGGSGETNGGVAGEVGHTAASTKRQLDNTADGGPKTGKKSRLAPPRPATGNEIRMSDILPGYYPISSRRFVGLSRYGGKLLVNIREYYEKDGKLAPGAKGISLTGPQFEELNKKLGKVDQALEKEPFEGTQVKLSENRFVTVREYSGNLLVDIREYYEKDLEMRPGKKGISLTAAEQWVNLKAVVPALLQQLAQEGGTGVAVDVPGGSEVPRNTSGVPSASHAAAQPPQLPRTGPQSAGWDGEAGSAVLVSEGKYRLGNSKKFVTLENWKGQDIVDIREHYQDADAGAWKPGKKGINLSSGQVQILLANLDAIGSALDRQDLGYALDLNNKRRVTISNFNGTWMVNIREYYERNGEMLPTKKGISIMPAHWPACREAMIKVGDVMTF